MVFAENISKTPVVIAARAVLAAGVFALVGCGSMTKIDLTEKLTIAMQGTFEAPPAADGNAEPKFVKFTLDDVTMTQTDGTVVDLYDADPLDLRIINRPQIIHEAKIKDYVGSDFSQITVTFAADAEAGGKYETSMPLTLATSEADFVEAFSVEKAKSLRLDISVQWKNTVTRNDDDKSETVTSPAFLLELVSK